MAGVPRLSSPKRATMAESGSLEARTVFVEPDARPEVERSASVRRLAAVESDSLLGGEGGGGGEEKPTFARRLSGLFGTRSSRKPVSDGAASGGPERSIGSGVLPHRSVSLTHAPSGDVIQVRRLGGCGSGVDSLAPTHQPTAPPPSPSLGPGL